MPHTLLEHMALKNTFVCFWGHVSVCILQLRSAGQQFMTNYRVPLKGLSDEDRKSRAKSLFSEYVGSLDYKEAAECVQELGAPGLAALFSISLNRQTLYVSVQVVAAGLACATTVSKI